MTGNFDRFPERLKIAIGDSTIVAYAKSCGFGESLIRQYLNGKTIPGADKLVLMARAAGVSIEWLATGDGPIKPGGSASNSTAILADDSDLCYVPVYDAAASAGHGAVIDQEHISRVIGFRQDWLRSEFQASPQDLFLIHVAGESMEPTLRPGEIILVDKRHNRVINDGIYLVRLDDSVLVKRLQKLPKGVIRVTSDNTAYQSFTISPDDPPDDFAILGRIIWAGRRL